MNKLLIPALTCCLVTAPAMASTLSLKKPVAIMSKKATTKTAAFMQLAAGGQRDNRDDHVFIEGFWPFMRQEQQLLFLQGGWQRQQRNSQISLGMGWRYFPKAQWGVGYNLFYDQDISQRQHRIGCGVEAWLHSIKLLVNGYLPANDWRGARDLPGYQQRAARGYDITLRGYLPPLPQLGASMRYTHYFGDGVAWSDGEKRYKGPQQWRWGIDYTPVPLLTLAYYHHAGFSGQTKHRLGIELTYHFNLSLAQHLDPNQVVKLYSAQGQRWSRVSREQMALNYTKVSPKLPPLPQKPPLILNAESETADEALKAALKAARDAARDAAEADAAANEALKAVAADVSDLKVKNALKKAADAALKKAADARAAADAAAAHAREVAAAARAAENNK